MSTCPTDPASPTKVLLRNRRPLFSRRPPSPHRSSRDRPLPLPLGLTKPPSRSASVTTVNVKVYVPTAQERHSHEPSAGPPGVTLITDRDGNATPQALGGVTRPRSVSDACLGAPVVSLPPGPPMKSPSRDGRSGARSSAVVGCLFSPNAQRESIGSLIASAPR